MRILGVTASGIVGFDPAYELISTTLISSNTPSVTFSNLGQYASTYRHLQIRSSVKSSLDNASLGSGNVRMRFNGDTGNNYAIHKLFGNGSVAASLADTSRSATIGSLLFSSNTANAFSGGVCDILDAYSTSKNKTTRLLASAQATGSGQNFIQLVSGVWLNSSSLTSIELAPEDGGNIVAGSRFSLYGIKG